jgi:hypothetical protein
MVLSLLQAILMTAFEKMVVNDPGNAELKAAVDDIFERYSRFTDAELQQRAVEYRSLGLRQDVASAAVQPLPAFEKRMSLLLRRLAEKEVRFTSSFLVKQLDKCGNPCMNCPLNNCRVRFFRLSRERMLMRLARNRSGCSRTSLRAQHLTALPWCLACHRQRP